MADQKISQLNAILGSQINDSTDVLAIVDANANETKQITRAELFKSVSNFTPDVLDILQYIRHVGDTDTSFGFVANDTYVVRTAGSERLRVASSGNVGIGVTSPTVKLDVSGTIAARGNLVAGSDTLVGSTFHVNSTSNVTRAQGSVQISNALEGREGFLTLSDGNNASSTDLWTLSVDSDTSDSFYVWDDVNSRYHFGIKPGTASSGTLVVDGANGRVGIGTSSPDAVLHAEVSSSDEVLKLSRSDINTYATVDFGGSDFNLDIGDTDGGGIAIDFILKQNGTETFRVDSSGNVGIGSSSPSEALDVVGNAQISGDLTVGTSDLVVATGTVGRVGINVAVPSINYQLDMRGGARITRLSDAEDREGYLTMADSTTDYWTLSVDNGDSDSFYLWDEQNSTYPFVVKPGANNGTLVVDGSTDRVGIGTASPSATLDVVGNAEINGNIAVTGTVDGRDVAADGSKLDGIDADADATNTANVTAAGALMDSELTNIAAVKALNQGVATTDSPSFAGLTVDTDTLYVNSTTNRVGIRNSSPNAPLHVTGPTRVQNLVSGREGFFEMYSGTGAGTGLWTLSIDSTDSNSFYLWDEQNSTYPFAVKPGGNSETLVVNGANGRVGIGTSSPDAVLHAEVSSSDEVLKLSRSDINTYATVDFGGSDFNLDIGDTDGGGTAIDFILKQNGTETFRVDSSGNVGIGTSSPSEALDVVGNAQISGDLTVDTDTLFVGASTNRVGIRNTSPNAPLHVTGPTRIQNNFTGREGFLEMYSGTGAGTALWTLSIDSTDSNAFYLWDEQNSTYPFAVKPGGNSETLVVNGANGRVGIGTSSPDQDLHIADSSPIIRLQDTDGTDQYGEIKVSGNFLRFDARDNTSNGQILFRGDDGTTVTEYARFNTSGDFGIGTSSPSGKLDVNGTVYMGALNTTALGANMRVLAGGQVVESTSSLRYKTDIEDANDAISEDVIYDSRPIWYRSLSEADPDEWSFWGFIAEELHEIDPRLVSYQEDENGDLIPDGVQYDRFVVHLVNVAQKQKARIDDLESRLAALEQTFNSPT